MKILFSLAIALVCQNTFAVEVGKKPESLVLSGDEGGRLDGTKWSSDEIKDKIYILFYVDPDEKDLNKALADRLKKEQFPVDKFQSVAIINMGATWAPNFAIESALKSKQKEHPKAIYVKDKEKKLVKKWKLADDSYVVSLFDKSGKVLYTKTGKLDGGEIDSLIKMIKEKI